MHTFDNISRWYDNIQHLPSLHEVRRSGRVAKGGEGCDPSRLSKFCSELFCFLSILCFFWFSSFCLSLDVFGRESDCGLCVGRSEGCASAKGREAAEAKG
jgi:hypothetical protein